MKVESKQIIATCPTNMLVGFSEEKGDKKRLNQFRNIILHLIKSMILKKDNLNYVGY
jgi:hypothetical protein